MDKRKGKKIDENRKIKNKDELIVRIPAQFRLVGCTSFILTASYSIPALSRLSRVLQLYNGVACAAHQTGNMTRSFSGSHHVAILT